MSAGPRSRLSRKRRNEKELADASSSDFTDDFLNDERVFRLPKKPRTEKSSGSSRSRGRPKKTETKSASQGTRSASQASSQPKLSVIPIVDIADDDDEEGTKPPNLSAQGTQPDPEKHHQKQVESQEEEEQDNDFLAEIEKSLCSDDEKLCPCCKVIVSSALFTEHFRACLQQFKLTRSGSSGQKSPHMRCPGEEENTGRSQGDSEQEESGDSTPLLPCPVCMKSMSSKLQRISHIKSCANSHNLSAEQLLLASRLLEKQAEERNELGLPIPAQPADRGRKNTGTEKTTKNKLSRKQTNEKDPDMQMAMALSRSMAEREAEDRAEKEEKLLALGLGHIVDEDRRKVPVLMPSTCAEPPKPNRNKSRNRYKANSTLACRTAEERERLISEKVAALLVCEEHQEVSKWDCNAIRRVRGRLAHYRDETCSVWNAAHSSDQQPMEDFYVSELQPYIEPQNIPVGGLLKNLSQIPGRLNLTTALRDTEGEEESEESECDGEDGVVDAYCTQLVLAELLGSQETFNMTGEVGEVELELAGHQSCNVESDEELDVNSTLQAGQGFWSVESPGTKEEPQSPIHNTCDALIEPKSCNLVVNTCTPSLTFDTLADSVTLPSSDQIPGPLTLSGMKTESQNLAADNTESKGGSQTSGTTPSKRNVKGERENNVTENNIHVSDKEDSDDIKVSTEILGAILDDQRDFIDDKGSKSDNIHFSETCKDEKRTSTVDNRNKLTTASHKRSHEEEDYDATHKSWKKHQPGDSEGDNSDCEVVEVFVSKSGVESTTKSTAEFHDSLAFAERRDKPCDGADGGGSTITGHAKESTESASEFHNSFDCSEKQDKPKGADGGGSDSKHNSTISGRAERSGSPQMTMGDVSNISGTSDGSHETVAFGNLNDSLATEAFDENNVADISRESGNSAKTQVFSSSEKTSTCYFSGDSDATEAFSEEERVFNSPLKASSGDEKKAKFERRNKQGNKFDATCDKEDSPQKRLKTDPGKESEHNTHTPLVDVAEEDERIKQKCTSLRKYKESEVDLLREKDDPPVTNRLKASQSVVNSKDGNTSSTSGSIGPKDSNINSIPGDCLSIDEEEKVGGNFREGVDTFEEISGSFSKERRDVECEGRQGKGDGKRGGRREEIGATGEREKSQHRRRERRESKDKNMFAEEPGDVNNEKKQRRSEESNGKKRIPEERICDRINEKRAEECKVTEGRQRRSRHEERRESISASSESETSSVNHGKKHGRGIKSGKGSQDDDDKGIKVVRGRGKGSGTDSDSERDTVGSGKKCESISESERKSQDDNGDYKKIKLPTEMGKDDCIDSENEKGAISNGKKHGSISESDRAMKQVKERGGEAWPQYKIPQDQGHQLSMLNQLSGAWDDLFASGNQSDVSIFTSDGTTLSAHSLVFLARCPQLYKEAFDSKMALTWDGVSREAARVFLRYLYSGTCDVLVKEDPLLMEVFDLALQYRCSDLFNFLESLFKNSTNTRGDQIGQADLNSSNRVDQSRKTVNISEEKGSQSTTTLRGQVENAETIPEEKGCQSKVEEYKTKEIIIASPKIISSIKDEHEELSHQHQHGSQSPDLFDVTVPEENTSFISTLSRSPALVSLVHSPADEPCQAPVYFSSPNKSLPLALNEQASHCQLPVHSPEFDVVNDQMKPPHGKSLALGTCESKEQPRAKDVEDAGVSKLKVSLGTFESKEKPGARGSENVGMSSHSKCVEGEDDKADGDVIDLTLSDSEAFSCGMDKNEEGIEPLTSDFCLGSDSPIRLEQDREAMTSDVCKTSDLCLGSDTSVLRESSVADERDEMRVSQADRVVPESPETAECERLSEGHISSVWDDYDDVMCFDSAPVECLPTPDKSLHTGESTEKKLGGNLELKSPEKQKLTTSFASTHNSPVEQESTVKPQSSLTPTTPQCTHFPKSQNAHSTPNEGYQFGSGASSVVGPGDNTLTEAAAELECSLVLKAFERDDTFAEGDQNKDKNARARRSLACFLNECEVLDDDVCRGKDVGDSRPLRDGDENKDKNATGRENTNLDCFVNECEVLDEGDVCRGKDMENVRPSGDQFTPLGKQSRASNTVTPMPDYKTMTSPQLKKELQKYGVRTIRRRKAVVLLQHLYDQTHPLVTDSEADTTFTDTPQHKPPCADPSNKRSQAPAENRGDGFSARSSSVCTSGDLEDSSKRRKLTGDGIKGKGGKTAEEQGNRGRGRGRRGGKVKGKETERAGEPVDENIGREKSSAAGRGSRGTGKSSSAGEWKTKGGHAGKSRSTKSSESPNADDESDQLNSSQTSTTSTESSGLECFEESYAADVENECITSTQQVSLVNQVFEFIKSDPDLHQKVLLYQPFFIEELHSALKANGVKCKMNSLMDVLDEQCITFRTQPGQRNRQRTRRSPKKRKVKSPSKSKKHPSPEEEPT